jgi:energy-coupling factor transporter ATP-binding protein EcfA2
MNRPRWKLKVEGLGKIREAEVEVHPLMLFVGDNDSGKSQLASLLWGLLAMPSELFPRPGPVLDECETWLKRRVAERDREPDHRLTAEERDLFVRLFNDTLESQRQPFVGRIFNDTDMSAKSLRITPLRQAEPFSVVLESAPEVAWRLGDEKVLIRLPPTNGLSPAVTPYIIRDISNIIALGRHSDWEAFQGAYRAKDPIYLPASRTGFMLLFKSVARRQTIGAMMKQQEATDLTSPTIQFLDLIAFALDLAKGEYTEEADFLESDIRGRIELSKGFGATNEYTFHPTGGPPLPMSLSSSMITELAPVIMVLRHMSDFPVLVLEEPEAHLHPHLQRKLAQVIVRLIRKGLYVWITTHSENFCQQINNFMKIGADPERADLQKQYGYGEQDYLELEDIAGYEFINEGDHSVVKPMKKTERGVVMPSFNKELYDLGKQVMELRRRADERE